MGVKKASFPPFPTCFYLLQLRPSNHMELLAYYKKFNLLEVFMYLDRN